MGRKNNFYKTQNNDLPIKELVKRIDNLEKNIFERLEKYININELKNENNSIINLDHYSRVIIYQFGKVGSSTLKNTFVSLGKRTIHSHAWKNEFVYNKNGKSLIINIVRKIQDRNMSAFFQNIDNRHESTWNYRGDRTNFDRLSKHYERGHAIEMKWMKNYYKTLENQCGISIFDKEWDIDKGYMFFPDAKCYSSVLILRYEDINEWEDIFRELFGIKINLIDGNRSEEKDIYKLYKDFKSKYVYPEKIKKEIWNIDFMKFFYECDYNQFIENENNKINQENNKSENSNDSE